MPGPIATATPHKVFDDEHWQNNGTSLGTSGTLLWPWNDAGGTVLMPDEVSRDAIVAQYETLYRRLLDSPGA